MNELSVQDLAAKAAFFTAGNINFTTAASGRMMCRIEKNMTEVGGASRTRCCIVRMYIEIIREMGGVNG